MHRQLMPILLVFLLFIGGNARANATTMPITNNLDVTLARDLVLIERYQQSPTTENAARLSAFGLANDENPMLSVFVHFRHTPDVKTLAELNRSEVELFDFTWTPPVGSHKTGFMLAKVRASKIRQMLLHPEVARMTAAYRKLTQQNDLTAEETGAVEAWRNHDSLTGRGVRLAVLDSGFKLDFPDLPDAVITMDYADYPDTSADVTDHRSGHGTHVAGTTFGSGELSGGRYRGMAYNAEPVYFKIGDDSTTEASTAATVGSVRAAAHLAHAGIATMSYGGLDGYNDGSSAEEQATDWAVSQGVTFFMSAGNSTQERYQYNGSVGAGDVADLVQVSSRAANAGEFWELYCTWFDSRDTSQHAELMFYILDSEGEPIALASAQHLTSPRGTELLLLLPEQDLPMDSVSYFIRVTNSSDQNLDFHLFVNVRHNNLRFLEPADAFLVLNPSTADSCISVAAYTQRTSWTDYLGDFHDDGTVRGELASFSAQGPRIDHVLKPEITAPGRRTISCRNQDIVALDGGYRTLIVSNEGESGEPADYFAVMGTSMSSPAAAGVAALFLEQEPEMSPAELRQSIFFSARSDENTGETPNTVWGWGKIDISSKLGIADDSDHATIPISLSIVEVFPNPFNGVLNIRFDSASPAPVEVRMYDLSGRSVGVSTIDIASVGRQHWISTEFGDLSSGLYFIRLNQDSRSAVRMVNLLK